MIHRTYVCADCNHVLNLELRADQWDQPAPDCPACLARPMGQEFSPPAIGGSVQGRAAALAEQIAREDYHVTNLRSDKGIGAVTQVTYRDTTPSLPAATWARANQEMLEGAVAAGRASRLRHGSGLDVLQHALQTGAQPDLIAASKKRSTRIW